MSPYAAPQPKYKQQMRSNSSGAAPLFEVLDDQKIDSKDRDSLSTELLQV